MTTEKSKKWIFRISLIAALLYAAGSLFLFFDYRARLIRERERVYHIADQFELWEKIARVRGGKFDPKLFEKDERGIKIEEVIETEKLPHLKNGEKCYVMSYTVPFQKRREKLEAYFLDSVLSSYCSMIVDRSGKIRLMFWDKP